MQITSSTELIHQHLTLAREASSGRSAHTVYGGHEQDLRQTMIALAGGRHLDDHENPGEATLQVLYGTVRPTAGASDWEAGPGDHLIIPPSRHGLTALEDCVVLLTVAAHA
jgi:quercetin dioxygenase-like cupin family protein